LPVGNVVRQRLRAIQLKQWKRGRTIYRELIKLGAAEPVARRVAANLRRWWRNSAGELNRVFTIAYFDKLGLPLEPPGVDPYVGWCGRGSVR